MRQMRAGVQKFSGLEDIREQLYIFSSGYTFCRSQSIDNQNTVAWGADPTFGEK